MSEPQDSDTAAGGTAPAAHQTERAAPAETRPDMAFPPSTPDAGRGVPFPTAADPYSALPPEPRVQYFQPPGPPLPPRAWRRNLRAWVWPVSVLGGLLMLVLAVGALVLGIYGQMYFTASGSVRADCATGAAVADSEVRADSPVRLYDAATGDLAAVGVLRGIAETGDDRCVLPFTIDDVRSADAFLVEVGGLPPQRVTHDELTSGVVIG